MGFMPLSEMGNGIFVIATSDLQTGCKNFDCLTEGTIMQALKSVGTSKYHRWGLNTRLGAICQISVSLWLQVVVPFHTMSH